MACSVKGLSGEECFFLLMQVVHFVLLSVPLDYMAPLRSAARL